MLGLARRLNEVARFRTILDVGAHKGDFASWSRVCFPGAAVHCFEPLPACQPALQELSKQMAVSIHPYAIGDRDGAIQLNKNDFAPASSVLPMLERHRELWPQTVNANPINVEMRTLDSFLPLIDQPAFLKIDVQGYELHVIRGARQSLSKIAAIQAEVLFEPLYEGQADFRSVLNALGDAGFRFFEFVSVHRIPEGRAIYGDAVFVAEKYLAGSGGEAAVPAHGG